MPLKIEKPAAMSKRRAKNRADAGRQIILHPFSTKKLFLESAALSSGPRGIAAVIVSA